MKIPAVIIAPMAGGPSTPEMVIAAAHAGSLGFLAPGAAPASTLQGWLDQMSDIAYGVNLFTRQAPLESLQEVSRIIDEVAPGTEISQVDLSNDFDTKFAAILETDHPPAVVSATFGPFQREEINALHERGIEAWITVTCPEDAFEAAAVGADALVVQGPDAGGHRSTWTVEETPDVRDLEELLRAVVEAGVTTPLIAAGGIRSAMDVEATLALPGVVAVSCGSSFLLADEAGTTSFNRDLLRAGGTSVSSRAFSGRVARGVETDFTRQHPQMPPIYPYLAPLVSPLRKENPREYAYCLVGTGIDKLQSGSTASILRLLAPHQGVRG